jgi:hypothetical protein
MGIREVLYVYKGFQSCEECVYDLKVELSIKTDSIENMVILDALEHNKRSD